MTDERKTRSGANIYTVLIVVLVLVSGFVGIYGLDLTLKHNDLVKANIFEKEYRLAATLSTEARSFYDVASAGYDVRDYSSVINNCVLSREKSHDYIQEIRVLKAKFKDEDSDLLLISKSMADEQIKIYANLYEACEYFESAARNLANEDYASAESNIDWMNEKIALHDEAVEAHNTLKAEYVVELEGEYLI